MNSINIIIVIGFIALVYLVAIPMVYHVAKFGLEEEFWDLYSNKLSIGEASKLLIKYNKRCFNGMFIISLLLLIFGLLSISKL